MQYWAALDGLRAVAILLVLLRHSRVIPAASAGVVGVTTFFTLSGFLITALLLDEHGQGGTIDLRAFFRRRVVRLVPALAGFLVIVVAAGIVSLSQAAAVATYSANWVRALTGDALGAVGHTWSLAIEEQFYLVWPLVVLAALRFARRPLRALLGVSAVLICIGVSERIAIGLQDVPRVYFGTDTNAPALLGGAVLAFAYRRYSPRCPRWVGSTAIVAIIALGFAPGGVWSYIVVPILVPVLAIAAIHSVVSGGAPSWLSGRYAVGLGRRSYGLYLWHFPFVWGGAAWTGLPLVPAVVVGVTVSLIATELSWRFIEQPSQRWRHRRVRERSAATPLVLREAS